MCRVYAVAVLSMLSCGSDKADECDVGDIGGRPAAAVIDESDWMAVEGTWVESGSSVNINLNSSDSRTINIVGMNSVDGVDVLTLITQESFPIEIDLGESDGYAAIMDRRNGLTGYHSNEPGGSGSFTITDVDGETLSGCFTFDAVSVDQVVVEVREGKVKIDR